MNIIQKSINTSRYLSATMINNAGSGHTGVSLGAATMLFSLLNDHLVFNPKKPDFPNRDRFVLSAGHAAPIYYALLHMFGYNVSMQDLKSLRKYGSKTPGHPEFGVTAGVEVSTGPLGQGVANAVGLAIAEEYQGKKFNTINMSLFDNYTYCFCGDGCLMEGVATEAISLAGTLGLNKLIVLYDSNNITIDGNVDIANRENVEKKFLASNWNVIKCDGNNYKQVSHAISKAKKSQQKPTIIICSTIIGYPSVKQNTNTIHGVALNYDELKKLKETLMLDCSEFEVEDDVYSYCQGATQRNQQAYDKWQENFFLFEKTYPELYKDYQAFISPKKIDFTKIGKTALKASSHSGRDANKIILNEVAVKNAAVIGGTADLGPSVRAVIDGADFSAENRAGRNIHYGVREHAMGAISNGIALYSSIKPFCSTFLSFSNYMIPAIRMAALMELPVAYYYTHDCINVGEDGPTHQPVEQITQLRAIPNVNVFRPANEDELLACYDIAYSSHIPSCFILSKNTMTEIPSSFASAKKGGYVIANGIQKPDVAIFATGSEVSLALSVRDELLASGVKVCVSSFPCLEQFERQNVNYKKSVVYPNAKLKVVIEASNDNIWYKYVGENGLIINASTFGKSGNGKVVYEKFGFNIKAISKKILEMIK